MDNKQTGIALFLVLWVLTLLSVIVGEFCHAMRTEVNITRNFKEETQAYYIATAGLNQAISELIKLRTTPRRKEKLPDEKEDDLIEWRFNADIPAIPFAEGQFKVEIGNESGKIDINRANRDVLKMMLNSFDIEESDKDIIADSVLDWRDRDKLHRVNGAEDDYYLSLPEPYECRDGNFVSARELLLVRGVTPEMFYGGLDEMITVVDQDEASGKKKKKKQAGKKRSKKRTARININAASPQLLRSLPYMTDDLVQEIMEYRKEKDFRALSELLPIVGSEVYAAIIPYLSSPVRISPIFTIKSWGSVGNIRRGVKALVKIDTSLRRKYRIIRWVDG
ncbi:type II secretion system protein GspK [Desulfococcaceae bacterium HSG8]|nr:type II secretion system protein GspK [Desulfococcaceae bacterium HSG8]